MNLVNNEAAKPGRVHSMHHNNVGNGNQIWLMSQMFGDVEMVLGA